ncbi:hypothetical protein BX616_008751 [Lobosporangium transversale]|uniref:NRDE-2, necessary for RNA interference-domain-containing protein n=1 Tax=Lobosporangium transversale TaxID=64571 RepID=A0A1Y2GLY3_9FUNG|nr:NRDE-2, necessary for RNA interference-domain-containing protein [Lobosporangium transversale]KAF9914211.1 hypothetical protein BX616_008751 [Lobosporangium transversale]ORZ14965.1 NRDE-2, necessary for RNA interference-domain-containing protein [Lobosporangium transversale]|eukprot:XP_021881097.1 NRDE-2, necessary for RNA interference-domain-containing protein [Lobosporangium transversale]
MSDNTADPDARFSAEVLDKLDLSGHKNAVEKTQASIQAQKPNSTQPPTFDSFPEIPIPPASTSSWSIPTFASFPVESLPLLRAPPLVSEAIQFSSNSDRNYEYKGSNELKSKDKKRAKKEEKEHGRIYDHRRLGSSDAYRASKQDNDRSRDKDHRKLPAHDDHIKQDANWEHERRRERPKKGKRLSESKSPDRLLESHRDRSERLSRGDSHIDRERRKEGKPSRSRSRSKSRERSSRRDRDHNTQKEHDHHDSREQKRSSNRNDRRRDSSRDRYNDRHSGSQLKKHHGDDRNITQVWDQYWEQDRHRTKQHSTMHRSDEPLRKNLDHKRRRCEEEEAKDDYDNSWTSRSKRDRRLEQGTGSEIPISVYPSSSTWQRSGTSEEKNKPGTWVIDVRGDQDFFRYGGINPRTIPKYNRAGGGRVLGMPSDILIDYEKTKAQGGKFIVFKTKKKSTKTKRYVDPHATWRDQSKEYKRISRAKAEELAKLSNIVCEDSSFISLDIRSRSSKRLHSSDRSDSENTSGEIDSDNELGISGKKKVDYRDIHGKSVYKEEDEDLMQTTSDQEEEGAESALDVLRRRRMMVDAELRKDPKQPSKWLEFIALEDEIDLVSNRRSTAKVGAHSTSHFEVKLSIFERALLSNPTNERLLLEYMNTCRQCWESAKVLSKWDELLQSNQIQTAWPGLWIEYLDYRQRHFLSFSVKSFVRVLGEGLERLGQLARSTWMAIQRSPEENAELGIQLVKVESVMVHIMARAWTFLKEAGYVERAQGIIQGQIEFLFNMPPSLATESWRVQIRSLEEFWDSELPRFGEKDAKGWNHYVTEEDEVAVEGLLESVKLPSLNAPTDELIKAFADNNVDRYHYTRWASLERELSTLCWFPIRTTEELPDQLEDDPYGIIIFDDIRPFISSLYSPEARQQYIECVFNFLGIPINSSIGSNGPQTLSSSSVSNPDSYSKQSITNVNNISTYNPFFHDSLLLNLGMNIQSTLASNEGLRRFFPEFDDHAKLVECILRDIAREYNFQEPMRKGEQQNWDYVWNLPLRLFPQSADTLFGNINQTLEPEKMEKTRYRWATVSSNEEIQTTNKLFIRRSLQQLIEVVPLSKSQRRNLSLYHMMYETLDTMSAVKSQKLAKKYLKNDRMDLDLWNAYAQAERALGRISEARKIYSTVLSMYQSFPINIQARVPLIYRYFAELEWEQDRPGAALGILVAFAEGTSVTVPEDSQDDIPVPNPTRLIKARQFYAQKVAQLNLRRPSIMAQNNPINAQKESIGGQWFEPALDLVVCFAWFEYLSATTGAAAVGSGLQSGIRVFENTIHELDLRNPDSEIEVPIVSSQDETEKRKQRQQPLFYSSLAIFADALKAEKTTVTKKICTSVEAEMVWIQLTKMVYLHSQKGMGSTSKHNTSSPLYRGKIVGGRSDGAGFQPRDLRRVVQEGLKRFPNCSILQSLFFWSETKQRLHGRVRTWVNEQLAGRQYHNCNNGSPVSKAPMWVFGIYYELWNQEPYNPSVVRSILEAALESASKSSSATFNSSPSLWLIYIELELRESARQAKPSSALSSKSTIDTVTPEKTETNMRVKQLLLRALNDCPWSKDLYMLAFEPRLRRLFSLDELDQLYETMLEKEIRLRNEIPEREGKQAQDSKDHQAWEKEDPSRDDNSDSGEEGQDIKMRDG